MPKVAVLVAAYNAAATLPKCLDSLLGQTLSDIEIICIDDSSTDDTPALLTRRAAADRRIKVLHNTVNSGQAVARNRGLKVVQAPYVTMVDADDWLSPDCLQQAYDTMEQHPETDAVAFRLILHNDDDGSEKDFGLPETLAHGNAISGREAFMLCIDGWRLHGTYLVRTELHRRIPYDESTMLYSDDNTSRLHYLNAREVRACEGIYYYRQHDSSMTHAFSIRRFDFMEANLSLRKALDDYFTSHPDTLHTQTSQTVMQKMEVSRWYTFLACYRLYFNHLGEIPRDSRHDLERRFDNILSTFSVKSLPLSCRRRPGYWLIGQPYLFRMQQRIFVAARRLLRLPMP